MFLKLKMAGIDHHTAALAERERAALAAGQVERLLPRIRGTEGAEGCVLLCTCNRTELYLCGDCDAAAAFEAAFGMSPAIVREGMDAARRLFEVAAGLESQIFGDDQILTQVGDAAALARRQKAACGVLDQLFRRAVTAGKRVKTEVRLTAVPESAVRQGVRFAARRLGCLEGRRALVIGNGKMGRLAAGLLREAGCRVAVTLRTYRHGETVIPAGCTACPYDDRYAAMEGADLVVSATASPHWTLTAQAFGELRDPPGLLIDLAAPRDIDPELSAFAEVADLDGLGTPPEAGRAERAAAEAILEEELEAFRQWDAYREALPEIAALKAGICERLRHTPGFPKLCGAQDAEGAAELAVGKTVDLLLGGMKEIVTPQRLAACLERVRKGDLR